MNKRPRLINFIITAAAVVILGLCYLLSVTKPDGTSRICFYIALGSGMLAAVFTFFKKHIPVCVFTVASYVSACFCICFFTDHAVYVNTEDFGWGNIVFWYSLIVLLATIFCILSTGKHHISMVGRCFFLLPAAIDAYLIFCANHINSANLFVNGLTPFGSEKFLFGMFTYALVLSVSGFIYALLCGDNEAGMEYYTYVQHAMRGYSSSEFAKATGLKKKEVLEKRTSGTDVKGNFGEYDAYYLLNKYLPGEKKWLFNVVISEDDGGFQEIDEICFWRDRAIVIEAKNYTGALMIDENAPVWTLSQRSGTHAVGNAFIQNHQHINALEQYLMRHVPGYYVGASPVMPACFVSMGLTQFGYAKSRHDIRYANTNTPVIHVKNIVEYAEFWAETTKSIEITKKVNEIYEALSSLPRYSKAQLRGMAARREETSYYRKEAFRGYTYYYDDLTATMTRKNSLYTEALRPMHKASGIAYYWAYVGDADTQLPSGSVPISDPEYYYGKLLTENTGASIAYNFGN